MARKEPEAINLTEDKNSFLGELDYLNCFIGLAKSFIKNKKVERLLTDIQNDLFVIQANVANPGNRGYIPRINLTNRVFEIKKEVSRVDEELKKIDHFVIPEGAVGVCMLHCARTIVRKVERQLPGYLNKPSILAEYLDQVACLLFVLARYINKKGGYKERPPKYYLKEAV